MPRLQTRELLFIGLPTLGVIGCATFLVRQQFLREQDARGPYRTAISQVEVLPVSPFEAWQGFDTKIVVHVRDLGRLNRPKSVLLVKRISQHVELAGQKEGRVKSFPVTSQDTDHAFELEHPGILRAVFTPKNTKLKDTVTFLATTSGFDANAPLQLRGELWIEQSGETKTPLTSPPPGWTWKKSGTVLQTRSQRAHLNVPLTQASMPTIDRTLPPVDGVHAAVMSPVAVRLMRSDQVSGTFIDFRPDALNSKLPPIRSTAAQLIDEQGRVVEIKTKSGSIIHQIVKWDQSSLSPGAAVELPIENVPLKRGALKMKVWFALGEGWPVCIESEVRPSWMCKRARLLRVQSVCAEGETVVVKVRSTGKAPLKYESSNIHFQPFTNFDGYGHEQAPPVFTAKEKLLYGNKAKPLYSDWAQHITLPDGKSYWLPKQLSAQFVGVRSAYCDATNRCRIVYETSAFKLLKPGQSAHFSAQIGLQDDGFLPISTIISRPTR